MAENPSLSALKTSRLAVAVFLLAFLGLAPTANQDVRADVPPPPLEVPVSRDWLFMQRVPVNARAVHTHGGLSAQQVVPAHWNITGTLTGGVGGVRFEPLEGAGSWDFTGYSLFSMRMTNEGPGTVWVEARLENGGAQDWLNSSVSQSYLLPGETGVVTVGYPLGGQRDDSPPMFQGMAAKPNGWRSHWKAFNAGDIVALRILVRSSDPEVRLTNVEPYLAWPTGVEANAPLMQLPYIDRFGQAIPFDWDTKIDDESDLVAQRQAEAQTLANDTGPTTFDRFGGYTDGPQLEATGFFRTEKVNGRWWLVDPDGRLYWSHGTCSVNNSMRTPVGGPRRELFSWLPEQGTAEFNAGNSTSNEHGRMVDFLRINTMRKYGDGWQDTARDITHQRLRAWGMNTLGAWSDEVLCEQQRTPYTQITHVWHGPYTLNGAADPFEDAFEGRYRELITAIARAHGDDPWMLGVFLDNETHWHNDMIELVLSRGPNQPSYGPFIQALQEKYDSLDALNAAWQTQSESWQAIVPGSTAAWREDRDMLYVMMAERYYSICRALMDELLPNHLYLGSRIHVCPAVVAEVIARYVDVFSVNNYWTLAGVGRLPADADLPVMVTEFHFGTIDRGVLGMSLCPVHDQTQRARGYAAYVTAGLLHPNIVGTHWFAYADQPTVGRPGENYQMGMIDITDTPYPEFTAMTRTIGERMYELRLKDDAVLLDEVQTLIRAAEGTRE